MMSFPHHYEGAIHGLTAGDAVARARGFEPLRVAPPLEFGGPDDAWTPEHLLLAAVESCLVFTFRAVAHASRFEYVGIDVTAEGTVDRIDRVARFTTILLRPRLTVPEGADVERAKALLEKAERACLISHSLATPIRLEPEIVIAAAALV